jgi:ABC-type glycerol-3-phosphate transport system permease component
VQSSRRLAAIPTYLIFIALTVAVVYPLVWMVSASLKTQDEIYQNPLSLLPSHLNWVNYHNALIEGDFKSNLINSAIVTVPSVFLVVFISSLAAYAFARLRFPGRTVLFYLLLVAVMVPPQAIVIPLFQIMVKLGLINSFLGLILIYMSWAPVAILILTTFFRGIPDEVFEAAEVDGAGILRTYYKIALPLATPALATVAIFYFVWIFNDFLYPLVMLPDPGKATIPLGLLAFQGKYHTDWPVQNAALTLAMVIPLILYMFFQGKFVRGLTAGAVK